MITASEPTCLLLLPLKFSQPAIPRRPAPCRDSNEEETGDEWAAVTVPSERLDFPRPSPLSLRRSRLTEPRAGDGLVGA
eukprot:853794-Rhodomonas_salina.2